MMYMVPLQCFSTVTRTRVTALTVMAVGTRTLQDTHRHSLPRLQHNASWLPEAVCHWSTELRRPSRVNRYRTDCLQAHLSAQLYSYFIIRYMSVWWWYTHTDMYLSDCISKRKGKIYIFIQGMLAELYTPMLCLSFKQLHTAGIKSYTAALWQRLVEDSKIMLLVSGQSHEISWNWPADKVCYALKVKRISAPQ